jgi:hypothetical protein
MYDLLKAIAVANSYSFIYGRADYQNLHDELETGLEYIFLDPVVIDEQFDEFNRVEASTYSGSFMILVSSDIDKGDYDARYIDEIKPIIDGALVIIKEALKCGGSVDFNSWRQVEVINLFDYNLDGVTVTYNITENV